MIPRLCHIFRMSVIWATTLWHTLATKVKLEAMGVRVGRGLVVTGPVTIRVHPDGRMQIGERCRLNSGSAVNPIGGHRRIVIWVGRGARLEIGNRVGLSNCTIVALESVLIGDDTMVGGDSTIVDSDFHSLDAGRRLQRPDVGVRHLPVVIGARVFVGMAAKILKGTKVGAESVIGAGAVVTRTVGEREIWAGNPAVRVKTLQSAGRQEEG